MRVPRSPRLFISVAAGFHRDHHHCWRPFPITIALLLLVACATASSVNAHGPLPAAEPGGGLRYANTYAKDFVMDAPWRVKDAQTPIPIVIVLKDCDTDDIRQLHWIRCWDITSGSERLIWGHDFGDERIGDQASEHDFWTYITVVTEGHPSLPNGTPLTPANLGYATGAVLRLKVSIYYRDDLFNYTETRYLRVSVGSGAYPWPAGWYGGDAHFHSMYTNNIAEFGLPVPAVALAAEALGLQWMTITDHSCDLDETGDGSFSYATHEWEFTLQNAQGIATIYRNVFDHGSSWGGLGADIAAQDSPTLRMDRAVEMNLASVDADSYQRTLHGLFYNPEYIASPLSGAFGERPVTPSVPGGLAQLAPEGFAYAAHPEYDLGTEWGGVDWGVNGASWGDEDIAAALAYPGFAGIEAFNTRETRYSTDENDPWGDFDAGELPGNPYPNELLQGIARWDALLRAGLPADPAGEPRRIFLAGGSDAHGDLNYATFFGLDNYATDNAIGKAQTVVRVPGDYGPGNLPPMADLLASYRNGRSVVTDGPFLEIGIDRDGDGDWYDAGDAMIGDAAVIDPAYESVDLRWASLVEFGAITSIRLWAGTASATTLIAEWNPSSSGEGYAGDADVALSSVGLAGHVYLRAELLTSDGASGHRAYTNPIWVRCEPLSAIPEAHPTECAWKLGLEQNPFPRTAVVRCVSTGAIAPLRLRIMDTAGRCVRDLSLGDEASASGEWLISWDGRDHAGLPVPAGLYIFELRSGSATVRTKGILLR
ncbi:MAG: hypothetical protein KBD56_08660 [Candidatus Eisenbacteria bacterium]|nr:hypothetical protein [Candidatus Eisenbacteria bacterium]